MEADGGVEVRDPAVPPQPIPHFKDSVRTLKKDHSFGGFVVTDEFDENTDNEFLSCIELLSSITTSNRSLGYEEMANTLLDRYALTPQKLLRAVTVCISEAPHCAAFYANVACHINNKDPNVVAEIIENESQLLNECLNKSDVTNSKFILRFFSQLVNSGVVEASEFLDLCNLMISVTEESQINIFRCDVFTYLVLTALPWSARKLHIDTPDLLCSLLKKIETYMEQRSELPGYESINASISLCSPFTGDEICSGKPIEMLWEQTKDSHSSQNFELAFLDMYTDPGPAPDCVKHKFSSIVIPSGQIISRDLYKPQIYIITPETANDDSLLSLPSPKCINRFIIDDVITDLIRLYSHNHTECIKILMTENLFDDNKNSPRSHSYEYRASIVECIIKEVLALPMQKNSPMYYNSLIISLVLRRNVDITRIIGRIIRILFTMVDCSNSSHKGINFESLKNLVSWFSVHLNNFKFIWNWDSWKEYFESPRDSAKYIFIKETIECCVRLSYPQNIIDLTEKSLKGASDILPDYVHTMNCKYDPKIIPNVKLRGVIEIVQDLIQKKEPAQAISTVLKDVDGMSMDEGGESANPKHLLLDCVFAYGAKSISYLILVLERYQDLLRAFNTTQEEMFETLYIVAAFWKNNTQYLEIVIDRLTNYRIVSDEAAVSWLLSENIAGSFCHRMFFSRILHTVLYKSKLRLLQNDSALRKKLEAKKEPMEVDGNVEKEEGSNQCDEAEELRIHETNKKNIITHERSLFLLTFRRFSDTISDKFTQMRNEGVEVPEETAWSRWMFDHLTHVGTYFREEVNSCSDDIERALFASGNIETSVAAHWRALKSYNQLY